MATITASFTRQGSCGSTGNIYTCFRIGNTGSSSTGDLGGSGSGTNYRNTIAVRFDSLNVSSVSTATMTINFNLSSSDYKNATQTITVQPCANFTNSTTGSALPTMYSGSTTGSLAANTASITIDVKTVLNNALSNGSECLYISANADDNRKRVSSIVLNYTVVYPLSIELDGGTWNGHTSDFTVSQAAGTSYTISGEPTKTGYTFLGWAEGGNGNFAWNNYDPTFARGNVIDNIIAYNNATSTGSVTIGLISDSTTSEGSGTSSGVSLQISSTGTTSPGCGGFCNRVTSISGHKFRHTFVAKVPVGYNVTWASNSCGDGYTYTWNTPVAGTGEWEIYQVDLQCGTSGTFSTFGYIYLSGGSNPVTWYLGSSQIRDLTAGHTFTFGSGQSALWARWAPNRYYIKYNANGGSGTMANSTHRYNDGSPLTKNTFTRTGYHFLGWSADSSATTARWVDENPSYTFTGVLNNTVNLYAVWEPNSGRVLWNTRCGTVGSGYTLNNSGWVYDASTNTVIENTATYGGTVTTPSTSSFGGLTRPGYTLAGWKAGPMSNDMTITYDKLWGDLLSPGTSYSASLFPAMQDQTLTVANTDDFTCYMFAVWETASYTLTLDTNGGTLSSGSSATSSVPYATYCDLPIPTKHGYEFKGWYMNFDGTNFVKYGSACKWNDILNIHFNAYMDDWSKCTDGISIVSCTQTGGWSLYSSSGNIAFEAYSADDSKYIQAKPGISFASLSAGWHTFDIIWAGAGTGANLYLDNSLVATTEAFTGNIGYNPVNGIFAGVEAGSNETTPEVEIYFTGKIGNLMIYHSGAELFQADDYTIYRMPAQDITLYAEWEPVGRLHVKKDGEIKKIRLYTYINGEMKPIVLYVGNSNNIPKLLVE